MKSTIQKFLFCFSLFIYGLFFTQLSVAQDSQVGSDHERELLGQLSLELESIKELAKQTQFVSSQDTRVKVRYDWLLRDLQLVHDGVKEILQKPSTAPRHLPDLKGAYVN